MVQRVFTLQRINWRCIGHVWADFLENKIKKKIKIVQRRWMTSEDPARKPSGWGRRCAESSSSRTNLLRTSCLSALAVHCRHLQNLANPDACLGPTSEFLVQLVWGTAFGALGALGFLGDSKFSEGCAYHSTPSPGSNHRVFRGKCLIIHNQGFRAPWEGIYPHRVPRSLGFHFLHRKGFPS